MFKTANAGLKTMCNSHNYAAHVSWNTQQNWCTLVLDSNKAWYYDSSTGGRFVSMLSYAP